MLENFIQPKNLENKNHEFEFFTIEEKNRALIIKLKILEQLLRQLDRLTAIDFKQQLITLVSSKNQTR